MEISSYKDNLRLWSAKNMRDSYRTGAPVMVIVMKEKFLCLISRVFCLVQRIEIENLFIRLTRWHSTTHNTLHITVISSFHLLLWWTYQTFMLQLLPVLWQLKQTETEFITSHGSESYSKINSLLLVVCTMLWCLVTEHSVSRLHSGTTKRGLSSDALCGELPPNIVTVRHTAERSA